MKTNAEVIEYEKVILTIEGDAATITLNRPKKKNACSPELNRNMCEAFDEIESRGNIKAIVITGAGDAFCGGMDLKKFFLEPMTTGPEMVRDVNREVFYWMRSIEETDAVTIASINGHCFGHGINMVALCDIAIANEDAKFGLSEVNFGVLPAGGTTWGVINNFNRKQGLYYSLTGDLFTGKEAVDLGLINRAFPLDQLPAETDRIVQNILNKNPLTLAAIKKTYNRAKDMTWWEAVDYENAKAYELTFFQGAQGWVTQGLPQFRDKEYKPGLGAYDMKKK